MKKQLLLASALFVATGAFSQNAFANYHPKRVVDMGKKMAQKYGKNNSASEAMPFQAPTTNSAPKFQLQARSASFATPITWNRFTGSENIFGMLVSTSRPLQYNDELGVVSFVHRKSHTYQANPLPAPTASTGVIVAEITSNWGATWDSTCIWSNNTFWARYPQGGIYNPSLSNTSLANTYIIGTGPATGAASSWQGSWLASKKLDVFNNAPSTAPGAQQFISSSSTPTVGNTGDVDFPRLDFSATDDGRIYVLGDIMSDPDGTTFATQLTRGARVLSAAFNTVTSTFDWTGDSVIPQTIVATDGHKMMLGEPHMAWNEAGTIGYVFFIGCKQGATGNNVGNQPIVFKKTPSTPWTPINGIDFNSTAMNPVLNHIPQVSESNTKKIPFFDFLEGIDGIVDANGKLHIMSLVQGTSSDNPDSLNFSFQFENSLDGETYSYSHTDGMRPYIFDFTGDENGWSVMTIDSIGSERPGSTDAGEDGFTNNPWDIDPETNQKVAINARLQMSRTPDGQNIVYTWAESDSITANNGVKWNYNPNLHARLLTINGSTMTLHPHEINITDPTDISQANIEVRGFAYNHYVSPKGKIDPTSIVGTTTVAIGGSVFPAAIKETVYTLPMTVSNNPPLHQKEPINHYYSSAALGFTVTEVITGIEQTVKNSAKSFVIYPNPAKGNAVLALDMNNSSLVSISITNLVGQQVKAVEVNAHMGQNNIGLDLGGLSKGVYMVNVKAGAENSVKKLIVE